MATVPNNATFCFTDVTAVVGGSDLVASFANAVAAQFDSSYSGSKNNLLNFRNYDTTRGGTYTLSISPTSHAGSGTFTVTVTASAGNVWTAGSGSYGAWIHVMGGGPTTGNGTFAVTVDAGASNSGTISITSYATTVNMTITR
jgi:hypothetical protein